MSSVAVTGGASGLGLETAALFADRGWSVALLDADADALERAVVQLEGVTRIYAQAGDVADEGDVVSFFERTAAELGPPRAALNAAGNMPLMRPTVEQPLDGWQRIVDVHLRGTYLCCREEARVRDPAEPLGILNVGSIVGASGFPRRSEYGPAKAAISHLTKTLAVEWARDGVRLNCILPGYVRTPSYAGLHAQGVHDEGAILRRTPMGRLGTAEEFVALAYFLLTEATYVTGADIPMDGGWLAYGAV